MKTVLILKADGDIDYSVVTFIHEFTTDELEKILKKNSDPKKAEKFLGDACEQVKFVGTPKEAFDLEGDNTYRYYDLKKVWRKIKNVNVNPHMSAATNLTPLSISLEMKATLRDSRSIFATVLQNAI